MKTPLFALALGAAALSSAQVSLTSAGYSQNFDSLGYFGNTNDGSQALWTDNQTLQGWYSNVEASPTSDGQGGGEAKQYTMYSDPAQNTQERFFASVGHDQDYDDYEDRALSFNGSSQDADLGPLYVGLRLTNDSGHTVNAINVSYVGEMWSVARSAFTWETSALTTVSYKVGASGLDDSGFQEETSLRFLNPQAAFQGIYVNGNDPKNQVLVGGQITGLNLAAGQDIWLRFQTPYLGKNTSGLNAIDNLSVSIAPVPEPATFAVLGLGALGFLRRRRA